MRPNSLCCFSAVPLRIGRLTQLPLTSAGGKGREGGHPCEAGVGVGDQAGFQRFALASVIISSLEMGHG